MLQRIREGVTGWVALLLLFIIGISFVFWGIDFGFLGRATVASVNGEEIPVAQIRQAVQNQVNRYQQVVPQGVTEELEQGIRRNVVDQFVRNEVLAQHTESAGFRVGDDQLGEAIREMEAFQQDGVFSADLYRTRLAMSGQSPSAFQEQMRRSLEITQLQQAVTASAFKTPGEINREARLRNERREMTYARFPVSAFSENVEPDDAGVEVYYANNVDRFMTPDTVSLEYVVLEGATLAQGATIEEDRLREIYASEVEAGRYSQPAERRASHILIAVDDDTSESDATTLATELTERLNAGEELAALAAEYSDDSASADLGGDLGWGERAAFDGALADAIFSMEPGDIRGPVRSGFGVHVVRLEEVRGGVAKPFEEVSEELRAEQERLLGEDLFFDRRDELVDLAYESDGLITPAETLGLEIQTLENVTRVGGPGIASNPQVLEAAFAPRVLEDRLNSDVVMLDDTTALVLRVIDRDPPEQRPLEQVRGQIVAQLTREASREAARDAGLRTLEAVREGADLATLAAENSGNVESARTIGRTETGIPAGLRDAVFMAQQPSDDSPSYGGVDLPNGDYAVYAVLGVVSGEVTPAEASAIQQAANTVGASEFAAYATALTDDADIVIRLDQLE